MSSAPLRSWARSIYEQEMTLVPGATHLINPVARRWASQLDCMESLVKNHLVVDRAFGALRCAHDFDWCGKGYVYVLDQGWWQMLKKIVKAYTPLRVLIREIRSDASTMGHAINWVF
jgi:hypothetical protein